MKSRVSNFRLSGNGGKQRVKLTGRSKDASFLPHARGNGSTQSREYQCLDCGHVGWSRHHDLEVLELDMEISD